MDQFSYCQRKKDCECLYKYKEKERVGTTCFIARHTIGGSVTQPCNGSSRVVFEDVPNNHNKVLIQASSATPLPCTAILIIETKDGCPSIERVIPFDISLNIEVENVRRISVRCEGNPTGTCQVSIGGTKTFCICCPKSLDTHCCSCCNLRKENCKGSDKNKQKQKTVNTCFVDTHTFSPNVTQPCNGSSEVVFEDVTNNHNKTMILAQSFTLPPCTATLIIETKDGGPPIERILPSALQGFPSQINIEVENVRRISMRCEGNSTGVCSANFVIQKTFCICCP